MAERRILACRPADPNDFPAYARAALADLTPLDPGWVPMICDECGMRVHMGPRQRTQYELSPDDFDVMDLICATLVAAKINGGTVPVSHLGGK